jgi:hypothetical protein
LSGHEWFENVDIDERDMEILRWVKYMDIARKYNLSPTRVIVWIVLESLSAYEIARMFEGRSIEELKNFMKEISEASMTPMSEEELKVYSKRVKGFEEVLKKVREGRK